jgi:hypothetical protein
MAVEKSECFLCDEQWPMSRDEPGEHDIEADGIYSTAPCHKPEEYAKYQARAERDAAVTVLWVKACERWPRYPMMRDSYFRDLLNERGIQFGQMFRVLPEVGEVDVRRASFGWYGELMTAEFGLVGEYGKSPEEAASKAQARYEELKKGAASCPLCAEPLAGEQYFHLACAQRENADDDNADWNAWEV